jgi:hypothetical protein
MGRTSTNFQGRYTAMQCESIRGYAEQLEGIQARETTTEKLLRSIGEEQAEELTGAWTAVERRQTCRQRSDLPKQCAREEEDRRRRR